jgi:hypothetical protein
MPVDIIHFTRGRGKPLVEDCLVLDLASLMRLGPIRNGQAGDGELKWSIDGQPIASAQFRLELHGAKKPRLILHHVIGPDGELRKQTIALTALPQHFGGLRWWMQCPLTGERVRTLHLPIGGDRFASRKAWNLAYRVERLDRFDRPFEKLFRAQRRLGQPQGLGKGIERPKGMWRRTYARHLDNFEVLDIRCAEKIAAFIKNA